MFCTPRARPDQNGPARSATAVNASPLSATVTTVATTMRGTASARSSPAVAPSSSMVAAAATVTQRSGRIRLATTSESWPAPIRPSAPADLGAGDQAARGARATSAASWTSQTSAKVHTTNCGTTSSTETPWMRCEVAVGAVGVRCRGRPAQPVAAGRARRSATSTAATAQAATGTHTAAYGP